MDVAWSSLLKIALKVTAIISARALLWGVGGVVISWLLLALLMPDLIRLATDLMAGKLTGTLGGHDAASAVIGLIVIAVIFIANAYPAILIGAAFFAGFPLIYFLLGKKNGTARALQYLYGESQEFVFVYLTRKFLDYLTARQPQLVSDLWQYKDQAVAELEAFLTKLKGVPFFLKGLIRKAVDKANFVDAFRAALPSGGESLDSNALAASIARELSPRIAEKLYKPSLTWILVTMAVEIAAFTALKLTLR